MYLFLSADLSVENLRICKLTVCVCVHRARHLDIVKYAVNIPERVSRSMTHKRNVAMTVGDRHAFTGIGDISLDVH